MISNILLITNKDDITTDFIVKAIEGRTAKFFRLNTEEIGRNIQVSLSISKDEYFIHDLKNKQVINLLDFDSVYFRRPEIATYTEGLTEGEFAFIRGEISLTLEGIYKILSKKYWLNNIDNIRKAENKIYQLLLAREIGFCIPESLITNVPEIGKKFSQEHFGNCIIKPIKSGLVEGSKEEGVIFTNKVDIDDTNKQRISDFPVFLQSQILKKADVRVTIVGSTVFAALIHSQNSPDAIVDWRRSESILEYSKIELPHEIIAKCIELTLKLKLNFGAIDLVLEPSGNYVFLEINPNGQWAWIEKQLNYKISDEIVSLLVKKGKLQN